MYYTTVVVPVNLNHFFFRWMSNILLLCVFRHVSYFYLISVACSLCRCVATSPKCQNYISLFTTQCVGIIPGVGNWTLNVYANVQYRLHRPNDYLIIWSTNVIVTRILTHTHQQTDTMPLVFVVNIQMDWTFHFRPIPIGLLVIVGQQTRPINANNVWPIGLGLDMLACAFVRLEFIIKNRFQKFDSKNSKVCF